MKSDKKPPRLDGSPWAKELYELFAPVRKRMRRYSEQQINDAIDEALKEVRSSKDGLE